LHGHKFTYLPTYLLTYLLSAKHISVEGDRVAGLSLHSIEWAASRPFYLHKHTVNVHQ